MPNSEIKGSRETIKEGKTNGATRLFISDDGVTPIAVGTLYPGDASPLGRRCLRWKTRPEIIPGISMHQIQYSGFWAYADTTYAMPSASPSVSPSASVSASPSAS